ncbi:MFS transporter [Nocardioidaceae bacterium]|nr:MFS transporter [Nocardioidaceae bacterium]
MATSSPTAAAHDGRWWTLGAVCLGIFMLLLDITIVNVALPDIQSELDTSLAGLQWVIDAYALSLAALLLTAGSLADLYGRKRVFMIGLALFTLGSALCGFAPDIVTLGAARAFQGIGGAAVFATGLAILSSTFSGKERGTAFGLFGATTGVAVAVGPVLGGVLTTGLSWRWIFFVNIPVALFALAVSKRYVTESKDPHAGRPDYVGFASFSLALGLLVFALIEAGERSFTSTLVTVPAAIAAGLLLFFVVSQRRRTDPMFDLALLRKPSFVGGLIAAFAVSGSIFSLLTYLTIYLQNVLGYSALGAGWRLLFLSGLAFFASAAAGRLTNTVPTKWLIAPGFLVTSVGLALLTLIGPDTSWTAIIPGLVVAGIGIGFINVPLASTAVGVVTPDKSGMASGVNSTFRQVGIATGIAALGSIFSQQTSRDIAAALQNTPASDRAEQISEATRAGQLDQALMNVPTQVAERITDVATAAFVNALDTITWIAAGLALVAGLLCFWLIRAEDFEVGQDAERDDRGADDGAGDGDRVSEPV